MNNVDKLWVEGAKRMDGIIQTRNFILEFSDVINELGFNIWVQIMDDGVDFNYPNHEQTMALMKALGLKRWEKEVSHSGGKIDYTAYWRSVKVRIYGSDPAPNCKIIEELVEMPAQPAYTTKKYTVVCKEEKS